MQPSPGFVEWVNEDCAGADGSGSKSSPATQAKLKAISSVLVAEIIMYCGGGYRSVLTADVAKKMGYKNVASLIGGYKGLVAANWPVKKTD